VLPLRHEEEQAYNRTGLAIHFLLGNIIALHTDLKEFLVWLASKKDLSRKRKVYRPIAMVRAPSLTFQNSEKNRAFVTGLRAEFNKVKAQ